MENLAHAVELALVSGKGGEAYFISDNETVELKNFLTSYVEIQGVKVQKKIGNRVSGTRVGTNSRKTLEPIKYHHKTTDRKVLRRHHIGQLHD